MKNITILIATLLLGITSLYSQHGAPNFVTINEIKTYGPTSQYDEFIELFNVSDSTFDLSGYVLNSYNKYGILNKIIYKFPEGTHIEPFHYYLLSTTESTESKIPDAVMQQGILSHGQLILIDSTKTDTLDAVAWGQVDSVITNEGNPARYITSIEGPPVSPMLIPGPIWSVERDSLGTDSNNNFTDFRMRNYTTPMNSTDSLNLILPNSLTASINTDNSVLLTWKTLNTNKDLRFQIYYKFLDDSVWNVIVPGDMLMCYTSKDTNYFNFESSNINLSQKCQLKIKEIDFTQRPRFTKPITLNSSSGNQKIITFSLKQNYPNPFKNETNIFYEILEKSFISISIFNLRGQEVRSIYTGFVEPGTYNRSWDSRNTNGDTVPSGAYFCVMHTKHNKMAIKIILLK
ncbi:MAG: T9SS C-terminal target domain-containing protein [Calditrichaeota bacterium]|nr:MAG: T9SS C-terminal target domain-containing protein [Calditrichota bacterium]